MFSRGYRARLNKLRASHSRHIGLCRCFGLARIHHADAAIDALIADSGAGSPAIVPPPVRKLLTLMLAGRLSVSEIERA
jgi:hypothetical protein